MNLLMTFYILNATLILLHEIESAYEKEWELLKLPGRITGFIIMHIPIILILFYGLVALERQVLHGYLIAIISGAGGLLPFLVHKILFRRKGHFNRSISNVMIYSNIFAGIGTIILSVYAMI